MEAAEPIFLAQPLAAAHGGHNDEPRAEQGAEHRAEAELLRHCRAGDSQAFAELVDRHKDRLVNYLTRMVGCRDRAEDLAQETFVRLYVNLDRFRDQGHLAAFLFRVATNLVRSEERRKRRWRLLEPIYRGSQRTIEKSVASQRLLENETGQRVSQAIAQLEVKFRAPLILREIDCLPYCEIATVLELSEGTVKSRIHRGKQRLRQALAPFWHEGT